MNRKVIREREDRRITWPKVGGVVRDGNSGHNYGVVKKREREKETVYPRGPGVGRRVIGGDMEKSVTLVRGIENLKVSLNTSPSLEEGGRRETGRRGGRVGVFYKIKIPANKGVMNIGKGEKNLQKLGVEDMVPRLKVDI